MRVFLLSWTLWLVVWAGLFAQSGPAADTAGTLIPASRFAGELSRTTGFLQDVQQQLPDSQALAAYAVRLDTLLAAIVRFETSVARRDTGRVDRKTLENELYRWNLQKEKLTALRQEIEQELEKMVERRQEIERTYALWQKSLEVNGGDLTPSNRQLLDSFLLRMEMLSEAIGQRNSSLMQLLQKISTQEIRINDHLTRLQSQLQDQGKQLLNARGPSLFTVLTGRAEGYHIIGDVRTNVEQNLSPAIDYLRNNLLRTIWILLLFIALVTGLYYLHRRRDHIISHLPENAYLRKAFILVSHPFLTALFLALLGARFILVQAPHDLYLLLYTFTLLPLFVLIPALLEKKNKNYFYMVGTLFLLDNLTEVFFYGSVINNLVLMVLAVVLIITLIRHSQSSLSLLIFPGRIFRGFIKMFNYLSILVLTATIPATFFGYYVFQEFVVTAYIWTYFAIYLYYAGNITLAGLFELLIYSDWARTFKSVKKYGNDISRRIISLLNLLTLFLWLYTIVALFGFREEAREVIHAVWNFGFMAGTLSITIGSLTLFGITIWISLMLAKVIQTMLEEDVLVRFDLERGVPKSISVLVQYTVAIIGFFIAAGAAGVKLDNLAFIFGALGVGIGFGLQDIINNFISGLILLFERPIHIGDNISVGELEGVVKHIGIRSSIIQTYDRSEVVVPNGRLISNEVINWTLSNQMRRLEIRVGVAYGSDPEEVMEVLKACALRHPEVMKDPPPYVWFREFGNSSIEFRLLFFYPRFDGGMQVRSEVAASIVRTFREKGIVIPFPQMDVHIREAMAGGESVKG